MIGGPAVWASPRLISAGVSGDLQDLVITVEAEDRHAFCDRLGEITAPTLVIAGSAGSAGNAGSAGSADPFYTRCSSRRQPLPDSRLVLYEGMRHPAWGRRFRRQVAAFLGGK